MVGGGRSDQTSKKTDQEDTEYYTRFSQWGTANKKMHSKGADQEGIWRKIKCPFPALLLLTASSIIAEVTVTLIWARNKSPVDALEMNSLRRIYQENLLIFEKFRHFLVIL